ncbi:cytochrome b561 [Sphingomonas naasensis]|uniref:Cytochrome b n=1 Tax=Sphingomonas naasensis TaxID=1344951 RepID=A0A4S1W7A7_9SPHN|nr:cytochrome b [Sphingomonas naasensis]NIJ19694.1 cytochrome b561 [Sphingomonas naasensis]TGX37107.1 cytochrome b [Sphingomonas naasensis]
MALRGDRYNRGAIAFHWAIAALVLVNLFIGLFHETLLAGLRVMPLHKAIGATVLVLSIARLGWRLTHRPPALPEAVPGWERALANSLHWLFYALLLILPLTGWIFSSNPERPRPVSWFGLFDLPLLPVSSGAAGAAHEAHELLGLLMTALVVLHIAAALRHHFLLRDRVLVRMLPWADRHG